jgi:hypothetical protein
MVVEEIVLVAVVDREDGDGDMNIESSSSAGNESSVNELYCKASLLLPPTPVLLGSIQVFR